MAAVLLRCMLWPPSIMQRRHRPGFTLPRSIVRPRCLRRSARSLILAPAAHGKAYTLPELIDLARKSNPGLAASAQATAKVEAQLLEASRSWMPTGEFISHAGARARRALPAVPADPRRRHADRSRAPDAGGPLAILHQHQRVRDQHQLLGACSPAPSCAWCSRCSPSARSPPAATPPAAGWRPRKAREIGQAADVELNVKQAYYGLKAGPGGAGDPERGHRARWTRPRSRSTRTWPRAPATSPRPTSCACGPCGPRWTSACWRPRSWPTRPAPACAPCSAPRRPPTWTSTTSRWTRSRSPSARWPTTRSRRGCRARRCGPWTTWWPASAPWPTSSAASSTRTWC